ncbi:PIN-like domain-containing protein [Streptomyces marispadix]|uniref:PIN-like domain-containing protein n=1 Tax=Streptomyces marispadix TaxID=2922868 RepID=A0ABS9SZ77_9ACTN|nr:PIN-like domain-containing protein [Streptomyces marispadix]MCH6161580.1 PIN-like domain-containing protein [Streptomyces marispadix]
MPDEGINHGLFDGFEAYRTPGAEEYQRVMTEGMVVLDTNVLLNLYLYSVQARQDLLSVLSRIKDQIWVPHQAIAEFWSNRESILTLRRNRAREASSSLENLASKSVTVVESWARSTGVDEADREEPLANLNTAFARLRDFITVHANDAELDYLIGTGDDPVTCALETILSGRVGPALSRSDYEQAVQQADKRAQEEIPPGYLDRNKRGDRAAGDYLRWEQTLREAQRRDADVLFVTQDMKEDWWRRTRGVVRGPRPELVREMKDRAGCRLFMVSPQVLLRLGKESLQVHVAEASEEQVNRFDWVATDFINAPTPGSFTFFEEPESQ